MNKKFFFSPLAIILLSSFFSSVSASAGPERLVQEWNERIQREGGLGRFRVDLNHGILFSGGASPAWAVDYQLDALGITKGFGTAGVDLFRLYSHEKFMETSLYYYSLSIQGGRDVWAKNIGTNNDCSGLRLTAFANSLYGPDILKKIQEYNDRTADRNERWGFFFDQLVPNVVRTIKNPKLAAILFFAVLILIGTPILVWNFSKAFFKVIFVRRPTILGPKDSDIYGSLFKRLFFRHPSLPRVVTNPKLAKKLAAMIAANRKITNENKEFSWFERSKKNPYQHVLAYGEAGVGKTLFAKKLAKKSGMHFMYLTVSDLSQMAEEEALQTLKDFFRYARKYGPTVMIIDEFDLLFSKSDIKAQKLAMLFQKEFSKAVDSSIQLFCITNYPDRIPAPFLSRLPRKIFFDRPNLETKRELFSVHVKRALKSREIREGLDLFFLDCLTEVDLEGLVGRDIEAIAIAFSLAGDYSLEGLKKLIEEFREEQKNMELFVYPKRKNAKKIKPQTW